VRQLSTWVGTCASADRSGSAAAGMGREGTGMDVTGSDGTDAVPPAPAVAETNVVGVATDASPLACTPVSPDEVAVGRPATAAAWSMTPWLMVAAEWPSSEGRTTAVGPATVRVR